MRAILAFLGVSATTGLDVDTTLTVERNGRVFNESCPDTNQAQRCQTECNNDFNQCYALCEQDDAKCKQLCNRDLTTCVDRCPCHDKCSWGCPCGFYQCSPPTNCDLLEENREPFEKCGIACIMEADAVVARCVADQVETEDVCYKKGNDAGIKCMEGCPCGKDCPNGCKDCDTPIGEEVCSDGDINNQEQCIYIWGGHEQDCINDVTKNLTDCMNACAGSSSPQICEDGCNADYVEWSEKCPCHTECPNGCSCPPVNDFGNSYCPTLPIADVECLDDWEDISQECRDSCTNSAYLCIAKCYGYQDCIDDCIQRESICVNHCPCYPKCPEGCPCFGWCEDTPPPIEYQCMNIWGNEAKACEEDRKEERNQCNLKCQDEAYPQMCEDDCALKYATDLADCPCHTDCANGCTCPLLNTLGNSYCPDGPQADPECLEDWEEESHECRNKCTTEAFVCSNQCDGDVECVDHCRDRENICIYNCPCYEGCKYPENPGCEPPLIDQCKAIWGDEAQRCEDDRDAELKACHDKCSGSPLCEDDCNEKYTEDTKDCPCHTDCANGCACPEENTLGNSYCPIGVPEPDEDCLEQHGDVSKQCRDKCTSDGYYCTIWCANDEQCLSDCRLEENICVSRCPCYPECPLGCPCPGWCGGVSPNEKCEAIWGDEAKACDDDCRAQRMDCLNACGDAICEDECNRQYLEECSYYCPCHTYCQNGCSCPPSNDLGNSYCPDQIPMPDKDCLEEGSNSDISKQCRNQCTDLAYTCTLKCYGDPTCEALCRAEEIECMNKCPCYPECPEGCPCPNWCGEPGNPSLPEKCSLIWGDEAKECIDDCTDIRNKCITACGGDRQCEDKCNDDYLNKCSYYCPCHTYCPNGCPCYNDLGNSYCPGTDIPDPNCIANHTEVEQDCRNSCTDKSWDCVKECKDYQCADNCQSEELKCIEKCPCHKECPDGCPCPVWCPAVITTTTPEPTTASVVVTTTAAPIAPSGSPIEPIYGDHLLILSRDGATVMGWPRGDVDATFHELTKSYQDQNKHFDINGYWTHDACSVQIRGKSYLIGGAYDCTSDFDQYCGHVNVQRAVMKLSETRCGLDIVMDGISQKLPYDMREHSCATYQKRLNNRPEEERVILCSPTDSADDVHTERAYKDRACWSSKDMVTWESEPWLNWQHIKGTMIYHKGRVVIMGGTGLQEESYEDHPYVEWLNQNGIYNSTDKTYGTWSVGVHLPYTLEEASAVSDGNYAYIFGGLHFQSETCNIWQDTATCNSQYVYRNQDPTNGFQWLAYGTLLHPRSRHFSIVMGDSGQSYNQLFHIAGYGKVTVNGGSLINGRMVEKWSINDGANGNDFAAVQRQESSPVLFNYVSPEAFIISETWYNTYCMQPLPKPNNDQ